MFVQYFALFIPGCHLSSLPWYNASLGAPFRTFSLSNFSFQRLLRRLDVRNANFGGTNKTSRTTGAVLLLRSDGFVLVLDLVMAGIREAEETSLYRRERADVHREFTWRGQFEHTDFHYRALERILHVDALLCHLRRQLL